MTYKNKLIFLLSLAVILSLIYTASHVFSPQRRSERSASYIWLDPKLKDSISSIVLNSQEQNIELLKRDNRWFVFFDGNEYPARSARIEDFLSIWTTRSPWPVRASSASSHERFALNTPAASRITIYGTKSDASGAEIPVLLDLLLNSYGQEAVVRRFAHDEVRSTGSLIASYVSAPASSWFNLRFLPENESGSPDAGSVQRISVYNEGELLSFSRSNRGWTVSGSEIAEPDYSLIENYIQIVLNSEGDSFADSVSADDPVFNHSRIVLEFTNGRVTTIRFSAPDEDSRCFANVSGNSYVYSVPQWVSLRLFRHPSSFERQ